MNIYKLISLFGKEYKDKELIEFFKQDGLDIVKEIKEYMKTDYYEDAESTVYVEYKKNGYYLTFEDELDYLDIEDGKYGERGNYYFTDCGFYSQGAEYYNEYKGELINGIKITNTRKEIRTLMKEPYKRHKSSDVDIWNNINGCQIFVDYKEQNTPYIISISLEK